MGDIAIKEEEVVGAYKANKNLGSVMVDGKHLLSTKAGKGVLETYEKAELIYKDHLTGLYNRRGFDEQLKTMQAHALRTNEQLWVAFMDADKFKNVNTKYGRLKGDEVLKTIAVAMKNTFRASDILARWGGDEFAAIMLVKENSAMVEEGQISSRLNEKISERVPFGVATDDVSVTVGVMKWDKEISSEDFQKKVQERMDSNK